MTPATCRAAPEPTLPSRCEAAKSRCTGLARPCRRLIGGVTSVRSFLACRGGDLQVSVNTRAFADEAHPADRIAKPAATEQQPAGEADAATDPETPVRYASSVRPIRPDRRPHPPSDTPRTGDAGVHPSLPRDVRSARRARASGRRRAVHVPSIAGRGGGLASLAARRRPSLDRRSGRAQRACRPSRHRAA